MQQLRDRRITNTPTDVPQVRSNCGLSLNKEETLSVTGLKTSLNNPDAAITSLRREKGGYMLAYVINKHGNPLMPCHPAKARLLLKQGKAKVIQRTPFTIQLIYGCSGYKQPITLGVDSGYTNIGLSAVTKDKEIYSAEVKLREDIVKLNSERRQYRRFRRYRKTWYRKPRFLNRKKPKGWLAPSIQHKLDSHIKIINQVKAILPVSQINIEVAAFDIQKIKNPGISGVDYQNGQQRDFWNVREYVLHRDSHTCQNCKDKSKNIILEVHHKLKELYLNVKLTYGYITKHTRINAGLEKSHRTDARCISGNVLAKPLDYYYYFKFVRKQNRQLYKANISRGGIRKTNKAPRYVHGFQLFDKVFYQGKECFVFGRRSSGYFDLRKLDGTKIHVSANYKQLSLIGRARTILCERRMGNSSPTYAVA